MSEASIPLIDSPSVVQCVPNFSEGRDYSKLELIADAIRSINVRLIDWSADVDHNRSVFTFVGDPTGVAQAALAAARQAIQLIVIAEHHGVHPRIGAMDVLPFVPLKNISMPDCVEIAHTVGTALADELGLPIFFYDRASESHRTLPDVRKHAFQGLRPDIGPNVPHPTAGAVAIGAREPLIAFNVNLVTNSVRDAKQIASEMRRAYVGSVRTLGLPLPSKGVAQVSINVIKPAAVSLYELVKFVEERSPVRETELIGAMPGFSAFTNIKESLKLRNFHPEQVLLETWGTASETSKE